MSLIPIYWFLFPSSHRFQLGFQARVRGRKMNMHNIENKFGNKLCDLVRLKKTICPSCLLLNSCRHRSIVSIITCALVSRILMGK